MKVNHMVRVNVMVRVKVALPSNVSPSPSTSHLGTLTVASILKSSGLTH